MDCVTDCKNEMMRNRRNLNAKNLLSGLRVSIVNDLVEVAFDILPKPMLRLVGVAVGPIDL